MQCNAMQWHSPALEKTLCHAPFLAYGVLGRSPCHPAPSSEHTVPFLHSFVYKTAACQCNPRHNRLSLSIFCECNSFFYRFVYKTTAMPNPKKKRSVIYPSLHDVLDARNAIQPRRKERSSAKCAAATLCLPISACQTTSNVVPTSYSIAKSHA